MSELARIVCCTAAKLRLCCLSLFLGDCHVCLGHACTRGSLVLSVSARARSARLGEPTYHLFSFRRGRREARPAAVGGRCLRPRPVRGCGGCGGGERVYSPPPSQLPRRGHKQKGHIWMGLCTERGLLCTCARDLDFRRYLRLHEPGRVRACSERCEPPQSGQE